MVFLYLCNVLHVCLSAMTYISYILNFVLNFKKVGTRVCLSLFWRACMRDTRHFFFCCPSKSMKSPRPCRLCDDACWSWRPGCNLGELMYETSYLCHVCDVIAGWSERVRERKDFVFAGGLFPFVGEQRFLRNGGFTKYIGVNERPASPRSGTARNFFNLCTAIYIWMRQDIYMCVWAWFFGGGDDGPQWRALACFLPGRPSRVHKQTSLLLWCMHACIPTVEWVETKNKWRDAWRPILISCQALDFSGCWETIYSSSFGSSVAIYKEKLVSREVMNRSACGWCQILWPCKIAFLPKTCKTACATPDTFLHQYVAVQSGT